MESDKGRLNATPQRRFCIGAELDGKGSGLFRVWAPGKVAVELVLEGDGGERSVSLASEQNGYFSAAVPDVTPGTLYRYRLNKSDRLIPDPASRFQPNGPHGSSQIVDPAAFSWTDSEWRGRALEGAVVYEMHIGTFTPEGTWNAAAEQLPELADLGISIIELMPVAEFPGRFGWGYDGVGLFAPTRLYGRPDDFRRFVNRAHELGLAVILDIVYNHVGPDGNYLHEYSADYFTDRYKNEWGQPMNFDGRNSGPVREFFMCNAAYWVQEFHLDGFRVDATQQMFDASPEHILTAIQRRVRQAAPDRITILLAENEPQDSNLVRSEGQGGSGFDGLWNDDFHHSAMVALTGRSDAYYSDYKGSPQEFISTAKSGFLYQGQYYSWQKKNRGTPALDVPSHCFVNYIQNHDQIANSAHGHRCHVLTSPALYRAMTALFLLSPGTPMLFQGQEFAASSHFLYFADHTPELAQAVWQGRSEFLSQFKTLASLETRKSLPAPHDPATFESCKLDFSERQKHKEAYSLHRDLLRLRQRDPCLSSRSFRIDGAILEDKAFVIRFFHNGGMDRLLVVNLANDVHLLPSSEPLLAPPAGRRWTLLWSSEDLAYGGGGTPPLNPDGVWDVLGQSLMVLAPEKR